METTFYEYFDSLTYVGWYDSVMSFYDQSYLVYVKAGSIDLFFGPLLDLTGPDFDMMGGDFGDDIGINFTYNITENLELNLDTGSDISSDKGFHNFSGGISLSYLY